MLESYCSFMLARRIARTQTTYKDINNFCNTTIILFLFFVFVGVLVFFSISPIQQVSVACFLYNYSVLQKSCTYVK